jgi:hypothetical protein
MLDTTDRPLAMKVRWIVDGDVIIGARTDFP